MRDGVDIRSIASPSHALFFCSCFSFLFLAGYFFEIGIRYIVLLSIGNIVVASIIIIPIFVLISTPAIYLLSQFHKGVERGDQIGDFPIIGGLHRIERNGPIVLILFFVVLVVVENSKGLIGLKDYDLSSYLIIVFILIFTISSWIYVMWNAVIFYHRIEEEQLSGAGEILATIFLFILASYNLGFLYAKISTGEICHFFLENEVTEAHFLFSGEEFIIARRDGVEIVLSKDDIQMMVCGISDESYIPKPDLPGAP